MLLDPSLASRLTIMRTSLRGRCSRRLHPREEIPRHPGRAATVWSLVVLSTLGSALAVRAQTCTPESGLSRESHWVEDIPAAVSDRGIAPPGRHAAILERIRSIAAMFRESYPNPVGTAAAGHALFGKVGYEFDDGPATYGYRTVYQTWMCLQRTGDLVLAPEPGNVAYVTVNDLHYLVSEIGEMTIDGERSMVWQLAHRMGEFRGETLYRSWAMIGYSQAVLLTRPGRVPWKPISRKQYLEALRAHWEATGASTSGDMDEMVRHLEERIAESRRTLPEELRDQVVAEMEKALAEMRARLPKNQALMDSGVAEEIRYITDYLGSHSEQELQQPATMHEMSGAPGFRGEFLEESDGGLLLVTLDPAYFRTDLPPDAPQLVLLRWTWEEGDEASARWRGSFERNFPLERLRAMIDR